MRVPLCPDIVYLIAQQVSDLTTLRRLPFLCKGVRNVLCRPRLAECVALLFAAEFGHKEAFARCRDTAVARAIIMLGKAELDKKSLQHLLQSAAADGAIQKVCILLEAKVHMHGGTCAPLAQAARHGHVDVTLALLHNGADIHHNGDAALHWAAGGGHIAVVDVLIKYGADVRSRRGEALTRAAKNGHLAVVRALISAGANIRSDDSAALMWAVMHNHADIAALLIEAGASYAAARAFASHAEVSNALFVDNMAALRVTVR
jgi:hypothetical protein